MFTRKHYKAIAEIIRGRIEYISVFAGHAMAEGTCNDIAAELADYFAKDNPRFDREKFLSACSIEPIDYVQTAWTDAEAMADAEALVEAQADEDAMFASAKEEIERERAKENR